jgi:hypothetical protein
MLGQMRRNWTCPISIDFCSVQNDLATKRYARSCFALEDTGLHEAASQKKRSGKEFNLIVQLTKEYWIILELKSKMSTTSCTQDRKKIEFAPKKPQLPALRGAPFFRRQRLQFAVGDSSRPLQIEPEPLATGSDRLNGCPTAKALEVRKSSQRILDLIIIIY